MFDDSLFESSGRLKTKKSQTLVISAIVHAVILVMLIIVPLLMVTDALPTQQLMTMLIAPAPPPPPPPPPVPLNDRQPAIIKQTVVDPTAMVAPTSIPDKIAAIEDPPASTSFGVPGGTGVSNGIGDVLSSVLKAQKDAIVAPPPPPPPPPPPQVKRQPIGGQVALANLIKPAAQPIYPPLARQARVSGVVILAATISKEGNVEDLRVVSGHPLLIQAAIDAVRQWHYRPTLLNGEPVEVTTTITVTFSLGSQ